MLRTYGLVTALARSAVLAYAKVLSFSESDKPVSFFYQPAEERGELLEKQGRTLFFQEATLFFQGPTLFFCGCTVASGSARGLPPPYRKE